MNLSANHRIIALDVGNRTCGVAISDELGFSAQPYDTLRFKSSQDRKTLFYKVLQLCKTKNVKTVVIGLPLNMNGTEGPQSQKVKDFIHDLQSFMNKSQFDSQSLKWIYWDERLSTVGAERSLLEADVSRQKRHDVIDKMAATFILQGYLESLR